MNRKVRVLLGIAMMLGSFLLPGTKVHAFDGNDVLLQINCIREQNGLAPYELSEDFCKCAEIRANEQAKSYSHIRPDGTKWYTVSPLVNRENIAHLTCEKQQQHIVDAWMQSESHKRNVLSPNSKNVGIGICETTDGECYIVMLTD